MAVGVDGFQKRPQSVAAERGGHGRYGDVPIAAENSSR
jgi:hypothetical protein